MVKRRLLPLGLLVVLSGCGEVKVQQQSSADLKPTSDTSVGFWLKPNFDSESVNCIELGTPLAKTKAVESDALIELHKVLVAQTAARNYQVAPRIDGSTKPTGCNTQLRTQVADASQNTLLAYSQVTIEMQLDLVQNEELLWSARHRYVSSDGGLPIDPVSLVFSLHRANENLSTENIYLHSTLAAHRLLQTLPQGAGVTGARGSKETEDLELLRSAGRYESLVEILEKRPQRSSYETWLLARSRLGLLDYQAAEQGFKEVILNTPENADAWLGLGLVKERQGRLDHAIAAYTQALELKESFVGRFELARLTAEVDPASSAQHFKLAGRLALNSGEPALVSRSLIALTQVQPEALTPNELTKLF